jgi:hypothetical protein
LNKFNLMDEVYYLYFHNSGVDITSGIITGMKVANVIDHKGHLRKNEATKTEYLVNETFGKYENEVGELTGFSYDLGDQTADTVFCNKVFATYDEAFEYLNNYIQEKKR